MARRQPRGNRGKPSHQRGGYKRHDGYYHRARQEGFAARSVYKLDEIQDRTKMLRPGQRVLDLGCAPGAWLQLAARIVGKQGRVVGIDLNAVDLQLPPWVTTLQADINDVEAGSLSDAAGGLFHVVLSDLAPHTTGVRHVDQARSLGLTEQAVALARQVLRSGGSLATKVFDGAEVGELTKELRADFDGVRTLRPRATRTHSKEIYLIASGFKRG